MFYYLLLTVLSFIHYYVLLFSILQTWILSAGRAIRGSKKTRKVLRRIADASVTSATPSVTASVAPSTASSSLDLLQMSAESSSSTTNIHNNDNPFDNLNKASSGPTATSTLTTTANTNIFAEMFSEEFDDLIWPLQYVDPKDSEQYRILFPLLSKLPHPIMYYLNELIFPEVLAHQGLKISTCGQELGGDMLFGRRIGFSGTPSDILPRELGCCHYEKGSDGRVVHYLTSTNVVSHIDMAPGWSVRTILDTIAKVCIIINLFNILYSYTISKLTHISYYTNSYLFI